MKVYDIVLEAGRLLKSRFEEAPKFREKERFELVSDTDREIEDFLVQELQASFGDVRIYSEEAGVLGEDSTSRWIVDPIDGTANFVAGVPYFAISLAREVEGRIVEAYVHNPVSGEFYTATADAGESCLGGVPIRVSSCTAIEHALVAFGFSANRVNIDRYYSEWKDVFDRCRKGLPLIVPSLTLCNVARGRLDAFIDFGCSMEGQAAASLILQNAGGTILNYDLSSYDHRSKGAVACGPDLMAHLIEAKKRENY